MFSSNLNGDGLPKEAALRLCQIAQELEEQARLARINLDLQTRRAGAAQININTPPQQIPPPIIEGAAVSSGAKSTTASDPVLMMKTLKEMFDNGL